MGKMIFDKNEIIIQSACDVDLALLLDFYQKAFPNRINSLKPNWKWLNRTKFYEDKIPLVLVHEKQVIAHSGMIPFNISVCGKKQTASWFIDFKILPDFQRYGLGSMLTKEWMSYSDCFVTFCNDKSIGVFKKFGWIESFNTYMHLNFILPFSHPGFVRRLPAFFRKILNFIFNPIFFLIYKRHAYSKDSFQIESLNEKSFNSFFNMYTQNNILSKSAISPIRDLDYAQWRVFNSPNQGKYHIYKTKSFSALISLHNNHGKYIDILWVTDINNKIEIKKMISTLGVYGLKKRISYIRFYTSNKKLSGYLRKKTKSFVSHPRFAFYSQAESILGNLKKLKWNLELIDGDFEHHK